MKRDNVWIKEEAIMHTLPVEVHCCGFMWISRLFHISMVSFVVAGIPATFMENNTVHYAISSKDYS
jgi:hypothetical protein